MHRPSLTRLPWLALAVSSLALGSVAHAAPADTAASTPPPASPSASGDAAPMPGKSPLAGFHALALIGYGASTDKVRNIDLEPYGTSFGLKLGYTLGVGAHFGAYFDYSLGRAVTQTYDPLIRRPFELTADASSINAGVTLGWDVPVRFLVLRYELSLGVTSMSWDFGATDPSSVHYGDAKNPSIGFHFAPGAALLWPYGRFEGGVGFSYFVEANGTLPNGFVGELLVGVKL